uniref:RGS domain-containing protein n=1 Tax=Chelydra serpentina TaxID=8475 RepID=A0A8C3TA11_CHESE
MTFEELTFRNPLMAVEVLSEDYQLFCHMFPSLEKRSVRLSKTSLSLMKRGILTLRKPSLRPRYLMEVLHNPVHMEFFRQFLKQHNAEAPLLFWQAVEKFGAESNPKAQRALINSILKNFFHNKVPAEELLQCQAPTIREISKASVVTSSMLFRAQSLVLKAMEEKWFKMYQDLYPGSDIFDTHVVTRQGRGSFIKDKLVSKDGLHSTLWFVLQAFIRSICKFRREMNNPKSRKDFEDFLRRELLNQKESMSRSRSFSCLPLLSPGDVEVLQVKRRIFNQRHISINFLVNDLSFYLEIDKFCHLADSAAVLATCGMYTEKDVAFLKTKVATITKLFLNSDVPPKLRVNISEGQKDLIRNLTAKGVLDRSLYHVALLNVFPVLIHFWKRYCNWKAMESFRRYLKIKQSFSPLHAKSSPRTSSFFSGGKLRLPLPHPLSFSDVFAVSRMLHVSPLSLAHPLMPQVAAHQWVLYERQSLILKYLYLVRICIDQAAVMLHGVNWIRSGRNLPPGRVLHTCLGEVFCETSGNDTATVTEDKN